MRSGRRFNLLVLGGVALACLVTAAVNTTVDPYRVTPAPWHSQGLDPYRDLSDQIRTGKAGLIRSGDWDVGLCGSSRVDNAWNPEAKGWGDRKAVNLGASGGFIFETIGIARYFIEHQNPELVVIGIDPGDLTSPLDTRPLSDYYSSPFGKQDRLNREIRYLVGISTFEASLQVLAREKKNQLAEYTPRGLRLRPEVARSRSQMKFIREQLTREAKDPESRLNPAKTAALKDFLKDCAARSCPVVIIFHPVHALLHARSRDLAATPVQFESTRRFLLEAVDEANALHPSRELFQYWDFCNFHPSHCELLPADKEGTKRMRHWNDLGHYDVEMGESVLGIALGWPPGHPEWQDQGIRITAGNLDRYLEEVRAGYHRYLSGPGAADVAWKETLRLPGPAD
ncbi:hypothetical protein [Luteolibacter marinus]|uniref:hypothetical protein n=1 Tax=Luteolibacter marinus TaxID=2776705 RepID=UPI001868EB56|nr:hypothetical protein [Luteolibacter marinus]